MQNGRICIGTAEGEFARISLATLVFVKWWSDIMSLCTWQILRDITGVLTNQRAPLGLLRQQGEFELIVSTLAVWSQQLNALSVN